MCAIGRVPSLLRLKCDMQEDWKTLELLVNTQEQENAVIHNDLTVGKL